MLQIGRLQRAGHLEIVVGHQSAAVLAPGALGKRDPVLRCELRELRVEPPAQDVRTLLEAARDRELSHIALDPQQTRRLDDRTDVVEDDAGDRARPPYRQHHGEEAAVGGAEDYGRRDLERDHDGREVGECDRERVVVGVTVVFGLAVAAIIERQYEPRLGRVGRERRRQGIKVGCSVGETGQANDWTRASDAGPVATHMQPETVLGRHEGARETPVRMGQRQSCAHVLWPVLPKVTGAAAVRNAPSSPRERERRLSPGGDAGAGERPGCARLNASARPSTRTTRWMPKLRRAANTGPGPSRACLLPAGLWRRPPAGPSDFQRAVTILQTESSRRSTATDEKYRPRPPHRSAA